MASLRRTHRCGVPGCLVQVPRKMLMCRAHWRQVPTVIQQRIHLAYRSSPLSTEHFDAIRAARDAVIAASTSGAGP